MRHCLSCNSLLDDYEIEICASCNKKIESGEIVVWGGKENTFCYDCGAKEGELHSLGCDMELCPFCGEQLISCDCVYIELNLVNPRIWGSDTNYLSPDVYKNGVTDEHWDKWQKILTKKGRIPWIQYPNVCSKCGSLWPDLFTVPNEEWKKYIQKDMRDTIICKPCYIKIKKLIDDNK